MSTTGARSVLCTATSHRAPAALSQRSVSGPELRSVRTSPRL